MKTRKLILSGLFVFGALTMQAQNVESNADVTSGGLEAGYKGPGNAFYGYRAGSSYTNRPGGGENNTYIGNLANNIVRGSNNVFVGYNSGIKLSSGLVPTGVGNGNIFIGANTGLTIPGNTLLFPENYNNKLIIDNSATTTPLIWGDFAEDQLKFNGKVGIGNGFDDFPAMAGTVDVESYNLFVYGGILTEEVRVMLEEDWADYVFEEDYNLLKLEEVEQFIKENKHLPNVPSAKEVAQNGIELGEIAKIQQEKIEELTLYLIQQQKELNELKEQVKLLLENQK